MGIRARLIFLALIVTLIPGLFFTLLLSHNIKKTLIGQEQEHLNNLARITKHRLVGAIEQNLDRINLIASRVQLRHGLERYLRDGNQEALQQVRRSLRLAKSSVALIRQIYLLDPAGRLLVSTSSSDSTPNILPSQIFSKGKDKPHLVLPGENSTNDQLFVAAPIHMDEKFLGVAVLETNASSIRSIAEDYTGLWETGEFLLGTHDERGDAVFLTARRFENRTEVLDAIPKSRLDVPMTQALLGIESSITNMVDYKGDPVLAATRYIADVDWGLVVKVNRAEVLQPLYRMMFLIGFLSVTVAGILIVITVSLAQSIVKPLRELRRGTQIIAEGNLQYKVGTHRPDEIGELSRDFDSMTKRLARVMASRSELAAEVLKRDEAERRFATVVEVSPNALILVDNRGKITLVNQKVMDLFGYSRNELIGESIERLFPDRSETPDQEQIRSIFRDPRSYTKVAGQDLFGQREDGSTVPVEISLGPLQTESGEFVLAAIIDITERKKARDQIVAKNRELETLLHVVSHDLKEPLRSVENFSLMVQDEYAEKLGGEGKDFLMRVVRASRRMGRLLDDILQLSRARRVAVPEDTIEMEVVVEEVLNRLEEKIRESGATVRVEKGLPRLRLDRTWATQALYNLVSNALKFTSDGKAPQVEIASYRSKESGVHEAGIVVRDRGPGVEVQHRERIFKLFQRAVGRQIEGTGAGLAIVRTVAEQHGGRTWVQPREGGGSEFVFTLPMEHPRGEMVL